MNRWAGHIQGLAIIICLRSPYLPKKKSISAYGDRDMQSILKQNHKVLYMNLFTSGRLNEYLASVDALAVDMFFGWQRNIPTGKA